MPLLSMMNYIIRNTRGDYNIKFKRQCKAMIDLHKHSILALLKTRMSVTMILHRTLYLLRRSNTLLVEALEVLLSH